MNKRLEEVNEATLGMASTIIKEVKKVSGVMSIPQFKKKVVWRPRNERSSKWHLKPIARLGRVQPEEAFIMAGPDDEKDNQWFASVFVYRNEEKVFENRVNDEQGYPTKDESELALAQRYPEIPVLQSVDEDGNGKYWWPFEHLLELQKKSKEEARNKQAEKEARRMARFEKGKKK